MKTGFQRWIGVVVAHSLFLCSISITCIASESATKATAAENRHPIADKKQADALLEKSFDNDNEAIEAYRKAIELDPDRSIAYLNLGDSLRNLLSKVDSFEEKTELTKEIKFAYLQYKQLSGKSTPAIDSFLALNVVDTPISDFCKYVAAYTNQARLRELFGSGSSVKQGDGQPTLQVEITYEGTALEPCVRLSDGETSWELDEQIPDKGRATAWVDNVDIVPFLDGHHLVYHTNDNYLVMSTPIGIAAKTGKDCRFAVHVTESFDRVGRDSEICRLVRSSTHPSFISFSGSEDLDKETLDAAGYAAVSAGHHHTGEVDFDNDGKTETLVHLKYLGGGLGGGCSYNFFDLLNEKKNGFSSSKRRSLLLEMQAVEPDPDLPYHVPYCRGNVTGWFRYKGITYFETKYPAEQPESSQQEFHTVSYIKDGKIHNVCEARFKIQIETEQEHESRLGQQGKSEIDPKANERLHHAVANRGSVKEIKTLLTKGGDVNAKNGVGRTLLAAAAFFNNSEVVKFLIDKGADVHPNDNMGRTALIWAANSGNLDVIKLLIDKGADVNARHKPDDTALTVAAHEGHADAVKLLIDRGADVNSRGMIGETALMYAAGKGNLELINYLLDKGTDVNAKDNRGKTALGYTSGKNRPDVVQYLQAHGAKE